MFLENYLNLEGTEIMSAGEGMLDENNGVTAEELLSAAQRYGNTAMPAFSFSEASFCARLFDYIHFGFKEKREFIPAEAMKLLNENVERQLVMGDFDDPREPYAFCINSATLWALPRSPGLRSPCCFVMLDIHFSKRTLNILE